MKLKLCLVLFCFSSFGKSSSESEMKSNKFIEDVVPKQKEITLEILSEKLISTFEKKNMESENRMKKIMDENKSEFKLLMEENKSELQILMEENKSDLKGYFKSENVKESDKLILIFENEVKKLMTEINKVINNVRSGNDIVKKELNEIKQLNLQIKIKNYKLEKELAEIKQLNELITNKDKKMNDKFNEIDKQIKQLITATIPSKSCKELHLRGDKTSGVRTVYPFIESPEKGIQVVCDQTTENGGWTVFQRRAALPIRKNFFRGWQDYATGFGNLTGEFWLGLININLMTKSTTMELRIDLEDDSGEKKFAKYDNFSVEDSEEKFRLNIGRYSGNAGNSLSFHRNRNFSTFDQDNNNRRGDCPDMHKGAWWYYICSYSNLNGLPLIGYDFAHEGIFWADWQGWNHSMSGTKMMFRPQ